jgi:hypothetical protein
MGIEAGKFWREGAHAHLNWGVDFSGVNTYHNSLHLRAKNLREIFPEKKKLLEAAHAPFEKEGSVEASRQTKSKVRKALHHAS